MGECTHCGSPAIRLVRAERNFDDDVDTEVQEWCCDTCGVLRVQTWIDGRGDDDSPGDGGSGVREPRRPDHGPPALGALADEQP